METLLRNLAKMHGKRVQRCEHYDRNVSDFSMGKVKTHRDPATSKIRVSGPTVLSGEPFTHKIRFMQTDIPFCSGQIGAPSQLISTVICLRERLAQSIIPIRMTSCVLHYCRLRVNETIPFS
jgi:hypothetical protein